MEEIRDRLSLEEMIKLARTAKKWCKIVGTYYSEINFNDNDLEIELYSLLLGRGINIKFDGQFLGEYFGRNKELKNLYKKVRYKCKYQKQTKENNQVSNGLDCARAWMS